MALVAGIAGCGGAGSKQVKYPVRAVTLVVPYAPGGSSDLSARPVADAMKEILGQPMVVVNKPGGGGSVGAAEVAAGKNDGYTLLNASIGPITIVPYTTQVSYNYESFEPIAQLTDIPLALAVSKNSKFQTLKDFVEYAKANPGAIKYGHPGAGNIQHITMERFCQSVGIKVTQVPYEGANPAVAALLGGHVDATVTGTQEITGQYKSGEIRVLGVTSASRVDMLPDVPTFKEQGYDLVAGVWYGVLAPKGTPKEIVDKLADAFKKACQDSKVLEAWKKLYLTPAYLGPEEFAQRIKKDAATNQKVVESIGLSKK